MRLITSNCIVHAKTGKAARDRKTKPGDLAIATYKKSLEVNPQNANAREKLKKLGGQ